MSRNLTERKSLKLCTAITPALPGFIHVLQCIHNVLSFTCFRRFYLHFPFQLLLFLPDVFLFLLSMVKSPFYIIYFYYSNQAADKYTFKKQSKFTLEEFLEIPSENFLNITRYFILRKCPPRIQGIQVLIIHNIGDDLP